MKANPDRYVIKPSGAARNMKRRLFVGEEEDGEDVIRVLEAYKSSFPDEIKEFQLQRRITGVEVAVGAFFNGKEFVTPINVNFEHKKLFPGNIGPSTGEMGTAMFWSGPNRLFNSTLKKMEARLAAGGLRRLHRPQLHRQRQRHLPARVHLALRLSDDQHPAGRDAHADRPVPVRPRRGGNPKLQGEERLPDRRAHRRAAVSVRRRRDASRCSKNAAILFKKRHRPRKCTSRT